MANSEDFFSDLQLLYELSLAVGRSLDPGQVCAQFLKTLLRRKDFSFGAFWVDSEQLPNQPSGHYQLLYAMPTVRAVETRLPLHHPSIKQVEGKPFCRITDVEPEFVSVIAERGIKKGTYAIFSLSNYGILKLYRYQEAIDLLELKQLLQVVDKLAIVLKGALSHLQSIEAHKQLIRETALLRGLLDSVPDLINIKNENSEYLGCNKAFSEYLGKPEKSLIGKSDFDLFAHEVAKQQKAKDQAMLETGDAQRWEEWIRYPDGRQVLLDTLKTPFYSSVGEALGVIGISRDITERKEAEAKILNQQRFLATVIDAVADPVLVIDKRYQIRISNERAKRVFQLLKNPLPLMEDLKTCLQQMFQQLPKLVPSQQDSCAVVYIESDQQPIRQSKILRTHQGERAFELTASAYQGDKGGMEGVVLVARDITEQQKAEEKIQFMAHHDALTGLPNRDLLRDRFSHALKMAKRTNEKVALLFLDLDDFKSVNDTLGHQVGDLLLQAVVTHLRERVREVDTISRQGGDEFLIMLPRLHRLDSIEQVSKALLSCCKTPFKVLDYRLHTSFSIGISIYPDDGIDFDSLLQKADTAMYSAKAAGRNTFHFYTKEMNQAALEKLQLQTRLHKAFNEGELSLAYQPQVDMHEGNIIGVEVLLRWFSREFGTIPPERFISIAEESGLIIPIGSWVLKEACRQAALWREGGLSDLTISVNLSALQFSRDDLSSTILKILDETGLPAQQLELELTESILIQDTRNVLQTVTELKRAGIKLTIDDFGTGYSSLSYLKKLNVDRLKIDRSFVRDLLDDPEDAALSRAIIQMAHSLKLEVVAEGVEYHNQAQWLLSEGCQLAQGNYFFKPLTANELNTLLTKSISPGQSTTS